MNSRSDLFRMARPVSPAQTAIRAHVAAFCKAPGCALDPTLAQLTARGARLSVFPLRHLPLDWFDRHATAFDIALIDADFLGDKVAMIDFGMRLRRFAPELPLVMLSSQITASDRSTERMAFCDVTLRLPLQEMDLIDTFAIALENHAYWRDSRHESRLLPPRTPRATPLPLSGDDARDSPPTD